MIKKLIKGYFLSVLLFLILTMLSAVLLRFTSLSEDLGFYMLLVSMGVACLFFAVTAGNAIERKGIIIGITAALVIMATVFTLTILCFQSDPNIEMFKIIYVIPMLLGAIGGIWGTNLSKA